jgi:hypothetical protein
MYLPALCRFNPNMAALGSPATLDERHSRALLPERQVISGLVGNQLWRGPRLRTGAKTQFYAPRDSIRPLIQNPVSPLRPLSL